MELLVNIYGKEDNKLVFKDKVALVTGGQMGIGKAIADKFSSMGADVAVLGCDQEAGIETALQFENKYGIKSKSYKCDVTVKEEIKSVVHTIVNEFGKIDFLINNAGIYPACPFLEMEEKTFSKIFDINVKGIFLVTQEVVKQTMKPRKQGKIICTSSVDSWLPTPGIIAYAASKAAVNSLIKSFAIELATYNITSNGVAPGWVATEPVLKAGRWKTQIDKVLSRRMADPSEIADIVTFLCEERADYINGEVINLSGGLIMNS